MWSQNLATVEFREISLERSGEAGGWGQVRAHGEAAGSQEAKPGWLMVRGRGRGKGSGVSVTAGPPGLGLGGSGIPN